MKRFAAWGVEKPVRFHVLSWVAISVGTIASIELKDFGILSYLPVVLGGWISGSLAGAKMGKKTDA